MEAQLATLREAAQHSGSRALSEAQGSLEGLARLARQVSKADIRSLISLRGEVGASVAASATIAQQAAAGTGAGNATANALQEARATARSATDSFMRDYFDNRKFDAYLQFASREDEEKYRRDEDARRREIEKASALNTPEGDLRATRVAIEQLEDAGRHGADRSPEYERTLGKLKAANAGLTQAVEPKVAAQKVDASLLAAFQGSVKPAPVNEEIHHGLNKAAAVQPGPAKGL